MVIGSPAWFCHVGIAWQMLAELCGSAGGNGHIIHGNQLSVCHPTGGLHNC